MIKSLLLIKIIDFLSLGELFMDPLCMPIKFFWAVVDVSRTQDVYKDAGQSVNFTTLLLNRKRS